ncbi:unnamed protein product [Cylindrotheca closterium]|uniref:Uncharacterized protein n=1 Tax=Cylindrotheca closterium TaxID=2856 RepID=A0AAD2GD20_9STRA|nr:unnamed protein product [Cylindrotheca closterium]
MAFEQQLEADRIDDFNLFSAFVRVPLRILEGVLGQHKDNNTETKLDDTTNCERYPSGTKPQDQTVGSPSRVVSDDDLSMGIPKPQFEGKSNLLSRRSSHTSLSDLVGAPIDKRTRQTSWSDESGLNLVEYLDESVKHDPISPYDNATTTKAPVIKSAMKRSTSRRNNALVSDTKKRYIPKMNQASLVMPSRSRGKDSSPTGEFSPQWGWYTSLTPPDAGMYSGKLNHHKRCASEPASVSIPEQRMLHPPIIKDENQANHVFQTLQNSHAPVGWTSVPI